MTHPTRILTARSPEWPVLLNEMYPLGTPSRLYARGVELDGSARCIGIVGTRRPSIAGLAVAERFAAAFARRGFVVVSGLAIGIDAAAHRAALECGGKTVGVLGCGADVVYPRRNDRLFARIAQSGTLLSEYPDGTHPERWHFPERNRIIAGMCEAVVVVEGAFKSGALITARCALDANREVFAVPGSPLNPRADGANELIRTSQAGLVLEPGHALEEIAPELSDDPGDGGTAAPPEPGLDEVHFRTLALFDGAPLSLDSIMRRAEATPGEMSQSLLALETRALIVRRHGAYELTARGSALLRAGLSNG